MKIPKTAPELERLILMAIQRHAVCAGISAVTVREIEAGAAPAGCNWDIADIYVPGGLVPAPCREACADAVAALQRDYELLPFHKLELEEDF
jgi:hypothetical protein